MELKKSTVFVSVILLLVIVPVQGNGCHYICIWMEWVGAGMCDIDGRCLCWWGWTGPNGVYVDSGGRLNNRIFADYCTIPCHYTHDFRNPWCAYSEERGLEPSAEKRGLEPTAEGRSLEPTVEGRKLESTPENTSLEPTAEGRSLEPTVEGRELEPTPDGRGLEPTLEGNGLQPTAEDRKLETTPDGGRLKPTLQRKGITPPLHKTWLITKRPGRRPTSSADGDTFTSIKARRIRQLTGTRTNQAAKQTVVFPSISKQRTAIVSSYINRPTDSLAVGRTVDTSLPRAAKATTEGAVTNGFITISTSYKLPADMETTSSNYASDARDYSKMPTISSKNYDVAEPECFECKPTQSVEDSKIYPPGKFYRIKMSRVRVRVRVRTSAHSVLDNSVVP